MANAGTGESNGQRGDSPLITDRGNTSIADVVVEKVAGMATLEVKGVHSTGGSGSRAVGAVTEAVGLGDERRRGVTVEVGEKETAIDLMVVVDYGESIPQVSQKVRENVVKRVEGMTGLSVQEVNIEVDDVHLDDDDDGNGQRVD